MSICLGIDEVIDNHLQTTHIGKSPHYVHRRSCNLLSNNPIKELDIRSLLQDMLRCLESNGLEHGTKLKRLPSKENWRWEPRTEIDLKNTSAEVTLERTIVRFGGNDWTNQIPTASGLIDDKFDKVRNLDLAHRISADEYELIELKVNSNNPLHAAIECLTYAALYFYTRIHYPDEMISEKQLLKARNIHWKVLAPADYYKGCDFAWLEERINSGIAEFSTENVTGVAMDYSYSQFPRKFTWPGDEAMVLHAIEAITTVDWGH